MTRRHPRVEAGILKLLAEWHPQHLTALELGLLLGGHIPTAQVRKAITELHRAGAIHIEPHAHHRHGQGRPAHRITLNKGATP